MRTGHTPGPWCVGEAFQPVTRHDKNPVTPIHAPVRGSDPCGGATWLVAWTFKHATPDDTWQANARLIAAAPDMLTALVACRAVLNGETDRQADDDTTEMVIAAIAKATGQHTHD